MQQAIAHIALVVRDYDEALSFYVGKLGFRVIEDKDQPEQNKRWIVISPPGSTSTSLLLARASKPEQVVADANTRIRDGRRGMERHVRDGPGDDGQRVRRLG